MLRGAFSPPLARPFAPCLPPLAHEPLLPQLPPSINSTSISLQALSCPPRKTTSQNTAAPAPFALNRTQMRFFRSNGRRASVRLPRVELHETPSWIQNEWILLRRSFGIPGPRILLLVRNNWRESKSRNRRVGFSDGSFREIIRIKQGCNGVGALVVVVDSRPSLSLRSVWPSKYNNGVEHF